MKQVGTEADKRDDLRLYIVVDSPLCPVIEVGLVLVDSLTVAKVGQYTVSTCSVCLSVAR